MKLAVGMLYVHGIHLTGSCPRTQRSFKGYTQSGFQAFPRFVQFPLSANPPSGYLGHGGSCSIVYTRVCCLKLQVVDATPSRAHPTGPSAIHHLPHGQIKKGTLFGKNNAVWPRSVAGCPLDRRCFQRLPVDMANSGSCGMDVVPR